MKISFRGLFPKPSQQSVARAAIRELGAAGITAEEITYDHAQYQLRYRGNRLWLHNLHDICGRLWPWQRRGAVREFLRTFIEAPARPATFADARTQLLPGIRDAFNFHALVLEGKANGQPAFLPAGRSLGSRIITPVLLDTERAMSPLLQTDLDAWGVSYAEAFAVALENLAAKPAKPFTQMVEGLYHSDYQDCYDGSRMLLPETFAPLKLKGEPVVFLPNWNHLLVTGSEDIAGLMGGLVAASQIAENEPRPISTLPLVRRDDTWADLWLPKGHPAEPLLRKNRVKELVGIYSSQKELIEKIHETDGTDVFVARYMALESKDGKDISSYSTWTKGVRTSLPRSEQVILVDPDLPDEERVVARLDWDVVKFHCAGLMKAEDYFPVRYYVEDYPSADQLEAMRGAQESRDGASATQ